jgi:hypothetical protein
VRAGRSHAALCCAGSCAEHARLAAVVPRRAGSWWAVPGSLRSRCSSHSACLLPLLPCSCCGLKSNAYDMWVSWTAVGCIGLVLALLCSAAMVHGAAKRRKVRACRPREPETCAARAAAAQQYPPACLLAQLCHAVPGCCPACIRCFSRSQRRSPGPLQPGPQLQTASRPCFDPSRKLLPFPVTEVQGRRGGAGGRGGAVG